MNSRLLIPAETTRRQVLAADPERSVWVAANAGSGKTHVLSRRVIRLLLKGVEPSRILCLTYTRAAAANMVNRVFDDLGRWAVMDDAGISAEIEALEGRLPSGQQMAQARQLFARALETPGGLKIQTIHAFCEAVLHQFPLEADIAGHFELLDAQLERDLLAEARRDLLAGRAGASAALAPAIALVLATAGEHGLNELLSEIVAKRDELRVTIAQIGPEDRQLDNLKDEFEIAPDETIDTIIVTVWPDPYFDRAWLDDFSAQATERDARIAIDFTERLRPVFAAQSALDRLDALGKAFLTSTSAPRNAARIAGKGLAETFADFEDQFERFCDRLLQARDRIAMLRSIEATDAALTIADHLISRYQRLKQARGYLDFNDLISRTINLLERPDAGAWVHYKLDQGLDHILVDEAQDTSPGQWRVVTGLAEEFFSGQSARSDVNRTVFAVGDEKQSIYSFQGAEPAAFAETGRDFDARVSSAKGQFSRIRLDYSFRSVGDVLSAVDLVFADEANRQGLTLYPEDIRHEPIRANDPGQVEIWPPFSAEKLEEPEDWTEAIDHASQPAVRLAEAIAEQIDKWIVNGERLEGTGSKISAGDILVLVRKRGSFVHALSRALKDRDVPVAGADRLQLSEHIAVKDMIALGRFAIQQHDDLSLAALLRSPVCGVSEDELFDLATSRGEACLWHRLQSAAGEEPRYADLVDQLQSWRNEAGFRAVPEFYSAILGRDRMRARMIARLGHEAGEILDEFVNFTFACEQAGIVGLGSVLETLESASPEIKREVAQSRGEVRIMTVHAAKGLEAPVVFLVDNGSDPFVHQHLPRLLRYSRPHKTAAADGFLWRAGSDLKTEFSATLEADERRKAEEEYRRLLYVAMTRAEDRLLVCGYHGVREPRPDTWLRLVSDALAPRSDLIGVDSTILTEPVYRYRSTDLPARPSVETTEDTKNDPQPVPLALSEPLPPEIALPRPFAPSGAAVLIEPSEEPVDEKLSPVLAERQEPGPAVARGTAIHRLLQLLPDMPVDERREAASTYLQRQLPDWRDADRAAIVDSVMRVLQDERFSSLFGKGSLAEVAIAGHLTVQGAARSVSGKIDRLYIGASDILIVDFKTNLVPPESVGQIPAAYIAQIAVYAALVRQVYPDHAVSAALLFTQTPQMFVLPDSVMSEALEQLAIS